MEPSADEVRKVARLARLAVSEGDVEKYRAQLGAVLGYVERLKEVDLAGVEPLTHVSEGVNRLDADEPPPLGATLSNEAMMKMAPAVMPPFVKVSKVLDEGGGA
jgi:aspartyl-tRNA(Asn)/glutamyl-tRNA(Gln) amidotransferase subunit C